MNAPILKENEYSVLLAELSTGIVLTTNFQRYIGTGEVFHVFQSYDLAITFINTKLIENSNYEFSIYINKGVYLSTKRTNE